MTADRSDEEPQFGLVMPFVVTEPDGPYNAEAFTAAVTFADLYGTLKTLAGIRHGSLTTARLEAWVPPALVPQLDLAAMQCGFTLTATPWDDHPDEWALAVFEKGSPSG